MIACKIKKCPYCGVSQAPRGELVVRSAAVQQMWRCSSYLVFGKKKATQSDWCRCRVLKKQVESIRALFTASLLIKLPREKRLELMKILWQKGKS